MLNWDNLFRRYVWHETKTPYFTPVRRLNIEQANHELFVYALLLSILFLVIAFVSLAGRLPHGNAAIVPLYAFSALCAAVVLGFTRHPWAAFYCASGPLAALAYFAAFGFHPNLEFGDKVVLVLLALGWLAYARRVVAIARAYPELPAAAPPG